MDHEILRAKQRSTLPLKEIYALRRVVESSRGVIPKGTNYMRLRDGSIAVLKDVNGRHVLATILSRSMLPPGLEFPASSLTYKRKTSSIFSAFAIIDAIINR